MPDEAPRSPAPAAIPNATDAIPGALASAGAFTLTLDYVVIPIGRRYDERLSSSRGVRRRRSSREKG